MTSQEIRQLVEDSYAARRGEFVDATLDFFDPDAVFRIVANPGMGDIGRTVRGHDQLRTQLEGLFEAWDWKDFPIKNITVDGDTAYVHSSGTMHFTPTDKDVELEALDIVKFKNGKIIEFTEFTDTHLVASLIAEATGEQSSGGSVPLAVGLMRHWFDKVWNQQDETTIHKMLDENCSIAGLGLVDTGPKAFVPFYQNFLRVFEQPRIDILDITGDALDTTGLATFSGRHKKSGKDVSFEFGFSARWEGGRIVEARNVVDFFGLMEQIGEVDVQRLAAALEA
ncbi:MAG: hypothetical protein GY924_07585 [Planctomycetaceae bacterium]|nr:hypothetical protein [Planctomycetaceae bacterium]